MSVSALCPACDQPTLLVNATSSGILTEKGVVVPWFGNPQYGYITNSSQVVCNRRVCGWEGTVKEARRATRS